MSQLDEVRAKLVNQLKWKFVIDGPEVQEIDGHIFRRVKNTETIDLRNSNKLYTLPIPKGHRGYGNTVVLEYMGISRPEYASIDKRIEELDAEPDLLKKMQGLAEARAELQILETRAEKEYRSVSHLKDLYSWYISWAETKYVLQRNDCSRLHHLVEAMKVKNVFLDKVLDNGGVDVTVGLVPFLMSPNPEEARNTGVFIVQHEWSKLIEDPGDPIRIPFPISVFEFMISGVPVIFVAATNEDDDEGEPITCAYVQVPRTGAWLGVGATFDGVKRKSALHDSLLKEVRAICISLEVEVLTHSVVRAPHALNVKREKNGKAPLRDHYLLNLSRRHRVSNPTSGHVPGHHKRLHLRRGHWRHYPDHKTWIKWTLAGDPSLGFVEKDYAL